MERVKRVLFDNFEIVLVAVLTMGAAYTVLIASNKLAFLNFFYIPVLLAAYFLGRRRGVLAGVVAVLLIGLYAVISPDLFSGSVAIPGLNIFLWGAFLIVTAYVVGTLYDLKTQSARDLQQAYEGILEIVAKFIDAVDDYTQDHSVRVSVLGKKIALSMGMSEADAEDIRVAGLLHDIGKLDINLGVLTKASALTPEEWNHMKTHTTKGSSMLEPMGGMLKEVLPIVRFHHEYYDGSGYHGVAAEDIPLGARVLAVADSYDAMITDRPYRKGRTPREAKVEIEERVGLQFDPEVVAAFTLVMRDEVQVA